MTAMRWRCSSARLRRWSGEHGLWPALWVLAEAAVGHVETAGTGLLLLRSVLHRQAVYADAHVTTRQHASASILHLTSATLLANTTCKALLPVTPSALLLLLQAGQVPPGRGGGGRHAGLCVRLWRGGALAADDRGVGVLRAGHQGVVAHASGQDGAGQHRCAVLWLSAALAACRCCHVWPAGLRARHAVGGWDHCTATITHAAAPCLLLSQLCRTTLLAPVTTLSYHPCGGACCSLLLPRCCAHLPTCPPCPPAADDFTPSHASIDQERVDLLAALDPNSIRFLTDLELDDGSSGLGSSAGMDAALIKWYFHPEVGAKLRSGQWMQELPEALQKLKDVAGLQPGQVNFDSMPWGDIFGGGGGGQQQGKL
jgi:hypothetical protein